MNILLAFRCRVRFTRGFTSRLRESLPRMAEKQSPQKDQKFSHRGPNSFVSIRITSAEIKHNISMVQQEMIKMMPQVAEIIQKPSKLHITLMVLRLQSDEDIETARKATAAAYEKVAADLANPLVLKFDKIGTFTGRRNQTSVVFANLCDDINKQRLMKVAGGGNAVKGIDDISPNVPHGVFLVKKPKMASSESGQSSITTAGLLQSVDKPSEGQPPVILQESSQVDSSSGGSLVLIRPQDVVTDDCNQIDSSLCSAQTVETNSGICETEDRTPPTGSFKQGNKSNCSTLPGAIDSTVEGLEKTDVDIDDWSHVFQETALPLFDHSFTNTNTVIVDQRQVTEDKEELSLVKHCLSQEDSVDQGKQSDSHSTVTTDHDLLSVDIDIQSIDPEKKSSDQYKEPIDQDKEPIGQDKEPFNQNMKAVDQDKESVDQNEGSVNQYCQKVHSLDQSSEDENPFSHLLLFSDNDSIDGVSQTTSKKKRRKMKSKSSTHGMKKKTDRKTPDSFVAVQFSSPELRHKLGLVQQHMVEMDKKLQPTLIPLVKLHITLMTLQLNNDTTLTEKAKECLQQCCYKMQEVNQEEIIVTVRTLQSFDNRVIYAAIEDDTGKEQLLHLQELVNTTFSENGLYNTDKKVAYTPHLTIAKTSKTFGRKRVKRINPESYEEHKHDCFGTQPINTLELLSMTLPADHEGYYHCFSRETFTTNTATQSRDDDTISDVKHSMPDGDERENITVMSAPCTTVKFIPRVLLTKKQEEPAANGNTTATTKPTETEMDLTEEK